MIMTPFILKSVSVIYLHYQQETNVSAKGKDIQRKEKQKCESVTKE